MRLFHDLIDQFASRRVERPALRYRGEDILFGRLHELSRQTAAGLQALGLKKGDRLALYLGNRPEIVEIALACSRVGVIFIPLSPMLRARQLAHALTDSGARALVTSESLLHLALQGANECSRLRAIILADAAELPRPVRSELPFVPIDDLRSYQSFTPSPLVDRDPAAILYTSGSTGRAKGVVVSHHNLVSGASVVAEYLGNTADDRLLAALPLSFDYGLSQVTTALRVGACAVLTNFSLPTALIQEIISEGITGLAGVPTMWAQLASIEWPDAAGVRLRYITNSGGALHPSLIRLLRLRLPETKIFCMYGLTEAFRSTYLDPAELDRRPNSIGKAIPNQEIMVLRPDGSACAVEETGELVHRGSLVTLGYWNDPSSTAERFRNLPAALIQAPAGEIGVWSGDLVRADAEGYLYFVGRADQLIKTSGYRVSPTEVEEVIVEVDGVIEAAAVGVPDGVIGQRIVVALTLRPGEGQAALERLRRHCRMQLPPYMAPADFRIVASLPRNANGKVDRAALTGMILIDADSDTAPADATGG
jgi:acyl-CoA ligase (AMP-forming) (exosortase A-associated)